MEQAKDFLVAVQKAPERVKKFLASVLQSEQLRPPKPQRQRENAVER